MEKKGSAIFQLLLRGEIEISDAHIKKLLSYVLLAAQRILDELGLDQIEPRCFVPEGEDYGTIIPKYDTDPYLKALGLPYFKSIIGRLVKIGLKDDRGNHYTIQCNIKGYDLVRGYGIKLYFDAAEHVATPGPDCGVYNIIFLAHEAAKKDMPVGPGGWGAVMKSIGTNKELLWSATIEFL